MKKLLYILLFIPLFAFGQVWIFDEGGNPFDGEYKTAQITAQSGEFPYHESKLVINLFNQNKVNVYITESGYFQSTSNLEVLWVFDNEPNTIYGSRYHSVSNDGETIFFSGIYSSDPYEELSKFELIEKLKKSNEVSVRIKDSYSRNDVKYSLLGSSRALNYVLGDYFHQTKIQQEKEKEILEEKLEKERKRKMFIEEEFRLQRPRLFSIFDKYNLKDNQVNELLDVLKNRAFREAYEFNEIINVIVRRQWHELYTGENKNGILSLELYNIEGDIICTLRDLDLQTISPKYFKNKNINY